MQVPDCSKKIVQQSNLDETRFSILAPVVLAAEPRAAVAAVGVQVKLEIAAEKTTKNHNFWTG